MNRRPISPILFSLLVFGSGAHETSATLISKAPSRHHLQSHHNGQNQVHSLPRYGDMIKRSFYLTMRDGVKIATDLILPKELPPGEKIPAILYQTRYWRTGDGQGPSQFEGRFQRLFSSHGYAVVFVDVRGTGASFGKWRYPWSGDEIKDAGQVVDWIVSQPWSNGKVGAYGDSYMGTTAELLTVANNPAVKAVIPRFNEFDVYQDTAFPGGVPAEWFLAEWNSMVRRLDSNTSPGGQVKPVDEDRDRRLLQQAVAEHSSNPDFLAASREITYRDDKVSVWGASMDDFSVHNFRERIEKSGAAIYAWGSWLDEGTADAVIKRFLTIKNPQSAVIGPWSHGGLFHGSPYLPADALNSPNLMAQWIACLRFFDHYLKGIGVAPASEKELVYYTMGEEKWKTTNVWPPPGSTTRRWYLSADYKLAETAASADSGADNYTIDFEATTGGANRWRTGMTAGDVKYGDRDREDSRLLRYTSGPLAEDIEITGHPIVTLYVTSTGQDGAYFVYLEDVDESGKVTYVTEGVLRAIHRKISTDPPPYTAPAPYHSFRKIDGMEMAPGDIAELKFGLLPTSVLVRKGHRLRIAIAGHDKSIFARIPASGTPTISVERNRRRPSRIDLPVIKRTAHPRDSIEPWAGIAFNPADLAKFVGAYELDSGSKFQVRAHEDQLMIEPVGQEAMNLLAYPDTDQPPDHHAVNVRAAAIIDGLSRNTLAPIIDTIHASAPSGAPAQIQSEWTSLVSRHGAYKTHEILGTALRAEGYPQTFIRVQFDRGIEINVFVWKKNKLRSWGTGSRQPAVAPFTQLSESTFAVFEPSMKVVVITFNKELGGRVSSLIVHSLGKTKSVGARKIS